VTLKTLEHCAIRKRKSAEFVASTGAAIRKPLDLGPIEKGETNLHADNAI
jgi:hypothetical protein